MRRETRERINKSAAHRADTRTDSAPALRADDDLALRAGFDAVSFASVGFASVPVLIREHGRAKGFERLRDIVLENPDALGTETLLPVLKLVIELDRHALFAAVSEAKARDKGMKDAWEEFQQYLRGDDVTNAHLTNASQDKEGKRGKKRGKTHKTLRTLRREAGEDQGEPRRLRGADPAVAGYAGPDRRDPEPVGDSAKPPAKPLAESFAELEEP